jgi:hypothetical protein
MKLFGTGQVIPREYLAVFHDNREHGPRLGRKRLGQAAQALAGTLAPDERLEYITPSGWGVVAVTDERILQIARGRVAAALPRSAVRRSMVKVEGDVRYVLLTGEDGPLTEPIRFLDTDEALALATVAGAAVGFAGPPLLSPQLIGELDRIGREAFGPPYPGVQPRAVVPSGPTILLDAAAAMGVSFPVPGSPDWNEYETRLCTDLLDAVTAGGEWAIAGALYVACDLDVESANPVYVEILDRAAAFLRSHAVDAAYWPAFLRQ